MEFLLVGAVLFLAFVSGASLGIGLLLPRFVRGVGENR